LKHNQPTQQSITGPLTDLHKLVDEFLQDGGKIYKNFGEFWTFLRD
jgi:hypothetical protein